MGVLSHHPVMLNEVLLGLNINPAGVYLDCTFGRGGHSKAIIQSLNDKGKLLAIDKDADAVGSEMALRLKGDPRFEIERNNFTRLAECIDQRGWRRKLSGVLMDLGVSSPQLDDATRGFSFYLDGPLDMRMDKTSRPNAEEWLNSVDKSELALVLRRFGEERFAKRIADSIVNYRQREPITRTLQLAEIIEKAVPAKETKRHPATRSFQAIRIHINGELEELKEGLEQAVSMLAPTGRLVVIAFHSLEDRAVKQFIREQSRGGYFPAEVPVTEEDLHPVLKKIGKAKKPSELETAKNIRARSAVLRIAEKLL